MAHIMAKRGNLDNIVTYEHYCDSIEDLQDIPENEITLGSTVVVIDSENNTIIPYIANSAKQWIPLISSNSSEEEEEEEEPT